MEWDMNRLSRYPFLAQAREYVKAQEIPLEEMLSVRNASVQNRALKRVEDAVDGAEIERDFRRTREDNITDLLSYPLSRFLVASTGDRTLAKWFSHHEGERARAFLSSEPLDIVLSMGTELGLPTVQAPAGAQTGPVKAPWEVDPRALPDRGEMEQKELWLPFTSFLPARRNISGASWNLVNLGVVNGKLRLNRDQYTRLLQEKVRERVEEGLDMKVRPPKLEHLDAMISRLKAKVDGRKKDYSPTEMGKLTITRLPPCMRQVLGMSQSGENLPHHARFALVTFLHTVGMSSEEIFKVFMNAPDFKGDIVRYQIEHITGASSATSYMVPNCDTMKTGGICYNPDGLCEKEWMTNPMIYYRVKGRKLGAKREDTAS